MIHTRIAEQTVNLPDVEAIPVPGVRAAFAKVLVISQKRQQAIEDRAAAERDLTNAGNRDRQRLGDAYFENPDAADDNPSAEHDAAKKAHADAQVRVSALIDAEYKGFTVLVEAIESERGEWADVARAEAKKAVTKLATATRMAEAARAELTASLGVLGMLVGDGDTYPRRGDRVSVAQKRFGYQVDLNPAVEHLRAATAGAAGELSDLS